MKKLILLLLVTSILSGCGILQKEVNGALSEEPPAKVLSNKCYGWGLKKNVKAPPDIPETTKEMMQKYQAYYLDTAPRSLYLTFDEGYENGYTSQILDILKRNEVTAAFFVTGPYLEKEANLVRRMVEEGHIVGNHTVHHPSMPEVTNDEKLKKEISDLNDSFREKFGQEMKYFRPPKGEYSERSLSLANELGYTNVFWSFAYKDWDTKQQKGTENAYREIMNGVHDGCVLLLHAVSKDNANVLERVICDLKSEGYQFRSLDEFGIQ